MKDLNDFISPSPSKTPSMTVQVIDRNGEFVQSFQAPAGFQLERYVDALYPDNELMMIANAHEVNISVLENHGIIEVYRGVYE